MGKFGKKNVVKIDPLSYSLCLLGESKVGKSTLIYQYCEKLAGEDGYLFIETGAERGADAISGINYINAPKWNMEYDEYTNSAGFADICEDIIENKTSDYPNLRVVVIDTYDQLIDIAEEESIRLYNKEMKASGKPTVKSINSSWGGFGRGEKKAMELMFEMRNRLLEVGVQSIYISHVKKKDVTDVVTGESYQVLTSDQQQNYFNALKKDLHFLALAYVDREIVRENTGKRDGRGSEIKKGKQTAEIRKIKFRDNDNYVIDSGSRFANIVPEISMNVDDFIDAITDAIKSEAEKGGQSVEALKKEQDKEDKKRIKEIAKAEEEHKAAGNLDDVLAKIKQFCADNKSNKEKLAEIIGASKERGFSNPMKIDNIDDAEEILKLCV